MLANLLGSFRRRDPGGAPPVDVPIAPPGPPVPAGAPANDLAARDTIIAAQLLMQTLLARPEYEDPKRLERHGWKAYSQTDEDGIIDEIFRRIGVRHRSFVEFGCGFGLENNSAYLLSQGWRGLWMDGGETNALRVRTGFGYLIEHGLLQFSQSFITRDNIDGLIEAAALGPEIDLLSIDLDGNDYYVWDAIKSVNARVVVIEYNAKFRPPHAWCMAYNATHEWRQSDHMGCSLAALVQLGAAKGYVLAGCGIVGGNAYFVRADLAGDRFATPATAEHLYQPARYYLTTAFHPGHIPSSLSIVEGAVAAAQLPWPPSAPLPELTFG